MNLGVSAFRVLCVVALLQTLLGASGGTLLAQTAQVNGILGGTLSNDEITAGLSTQDGHPTGIGIRTNHGKDSLTISGPFAIALRDGAVLYPRDLIWDAAGRVEHLAPDAGAARYSERVPGVALHYTFRDRTGRFDVDWALILRKGSHYIRQSVTITAGKEAVDVSDVELIDLWPSSGSGGATLAGVVKGSPLIDGNFYLGFEQPLSQCSVVAGRGSCDLRSDVPIAAGQSAEYSAVVGVAAPGQMRRDFLTYLERERAHPYRTFLHYNSWFDIGFFTPYSQQDALDRIHEIGDELNKKRGVTLDSFLFDDGWDDHDHLWKIRADFTDGFTPL